jgi:hypothetical protein
VAAGQEARQGALVNCPNDEHVLRPWGDYFLVCNHCWNVWDDYFTPRVETDYSKSSPLGEVFTGLLGWLPIRMTTDG